MIDKSHRGGLRILFADDEAHLRDLMAMELPRLGHDVSVFPDGAAALKAIERGSYDAALLDIRMPGITGIEVLTQIKRTSPETQVILLTGHATVDTAVQALRLGAFDYLTKPCKWAELEVILNRVAERRDMANKTVALESRLKAAEGAPLIIGDTAAMQQVKRLIDTIAPTDATVMILGETGTGKELVARNVHERSERAQRVFIPVNCGALPENLVESELFGHRKGAFTGAETNRKGLFEVANGGTLFLDEVGELPLPVQAKLLRALQNGEIQRLGADRPRSVDVRVVAATNRNLREAVRDGRFRADLYHRLSVYPVPIPPLRERGADVLLLAGRFLELNRARLGLRSLRLSPEAGEALTRYRWPGNVRELEHVISRAALKALSRGGERGDIVTLDAALLDLDVGREVGEGPVANGRAAGPGFGALSGEGIPTGEPDADWPSGEPIQLRDAVDACQRRMIRQALAACDGNWSQAARRLDVDASNLHKLARRLGLK